MFIINANNNKTELLKIEEFLNESQKEYQALEPEFNMNSLNNLGDSFNMNYMEFNNFSSDHDFFSN